MIADSGTTSCILSVEAESFVEHLMEFDVKDVGSARWHQQHEHVEKLNMQAVINAAAKEDEFVKEYFISYGKINLLIQDLITTEIWKQKVFPELIDMEFEPKTTFPIYIILYHEATVINLLETMMFYKETCEVADDSVLDLVDYAYRKLCYLAAKGENKDDEFLPNGRDPGVATSNMEELVQQELQLQFEISIKALSVIRYITDCLDILPLSVMTRILNTHDLPILLVQLVESPPWTRRKDGKLYKFIDSKWVEVSFEDSLKLTKTEGQVWIAIFNLLMKRSCQEKYELNNYRKNTIIKLRSHLTEVLLDQMPILAELQRYLEHLAIMDPPPAKKDLVLEQVPEMRDKLLKKYEDKWHKIASAQVKTTFNQSDDDIRSQAQRWAATYNLDVLEELVADPPKCAVCGQLASKRCSRCQNEWYCRRECQVAHWKKHKQACDIIHETLQTAR
ncbi:zinc finger MYND domain-containing protein 10-like [Physella acuta]|uniref:zinc finger MYND domain-containing protein 10-like n=1 Tax=Physella acuta TaxID=109671 RepID=UPI0027DADA70|nr:zinc finger MYND domain-containing protein 10-like [Physella acuta]XP_059150754.1 zinc finger MYND domain-containing protein 10-like [Physella acuta]XP_059150755.1 zinc finger MYND domain-containing protein 10-like [Physella acuta]